MLITFIRHVRRQSKAVRNQYALALAGVFTACIGVVWLYTSFLTPEGGLISSAPETEKSLPFSNLIKQTKEQWAAATEAIKEEIPATTTSETLPDSRNFILTEETISDQAGKSSSTTTVSGRGEDTKGNPSEEIEVQIATTSSRQVVEETAETE